MNWSYDNVSRSAIIPEPLTIIGVGTAVKEQCQPVQQTLFDRVYKSIEWVYLLDDCWQNWIYERYLRPTIVVDNS